MKLVKFAVGGLAGLLFGGGGKKTVAQPLPAATRDDAAAATAADDELRRRKGGLADQIVNGTRGAEPGIGSVGKLVVGN